MFCCILKGAEVRNLSCCSAGIGGSCCWGIIFGVEGEAVASRWDLEGCFALRERGGLWQILSFTSSLSFSLPLPHSRNCYLFPPSCMHQIFRCVDAVSFLGCYIDASWHLTRWLIEISCFKNPMFLWPSQSFSGVNVYHNNPSPTHCHAISYHSGTQAVEILMP